MLRLDVVRWAIDRLNEKRAHPFFLAYLHLRSRATEQGSAADIVPQWQALGHFLAVPGGPPRKPYFRPLSDPPGNFNRGWLNENLAGSFAPSSLREGMPPIRVVEKAGPGRLSLRAGHAELARLHLLFGELVSFYPLAVFLYRDFGFLMTKGDSGPTALREVFDRDWGFARSDDPGRDFDTLFSVSDDYDAEDWFEEFRPDPLPESN